MKKKLIFVLFGWLTIPHALCYLLAKNKSTIDKDIDRWVVCSKNRNPFRGGAILTSQFDVAPAVHAGVPQRVLPPNGVEKAFVGLSASVVFALHMDSV